MAKHEGLLLKIDSKGNISGYMQEITIRFQLKILLSKMS